MVPGGRTRDTGGRTPGDDGCGRRPSSVPRRGRAVLAAFDRLSPQGSLRVGLRRCHAPDRTARPRLVGRGAALARPARRPVGARAVGPHRAAVRRATWPACWPTSWPPTPGPPPTPRSRRLGDRFVAAWDALRYLAARVEVLEARHRPGRARSGRVAPARCPDPGEWVAGRRGWGRSPAPAPWCRGRGRGRASLSAAALRTGRAGGRRRAPGRDRLARPSSGARPADRPTRGPRRGGRPSRRDARRRRRRRSCWPAASTGWTWPARSGWCERCGPGHRPRRHAGRPVRHRQAAWDERARRSGPRPPPGRPLHPETWIILLRRARRRDRRAGTGRRRRHRARHRLRGRPGDETVSGVHLFVPMLHRHDAVGEHTLALRDRLAAAGIAVDDLRGDPRPAHRRPRPATISTTSRRPSPVTCSSTSSPPNRPSPVGWSARPEPLVVNYHSITPPEVLPAAGTTASPACRCGAQLELALLAPRAALGRGRVPLRRARSWPAAGCSSDDGGPGGQRRRSRRSSPTAPPLERLGPADAGSAGPAVAVGGPAGPQQGAPADHRRSLRGPDDLGSRGPPDHGRRPDRAALRRRPASVTPPTLGLADAVDFVTGISDGELAAHYRAADVLVMLSEHEGFGVPLVEAMGQGLPVVAFDAGAVPEVLGGCRRASSPTGSPGQVAEAVSRLLADAGGREHLAGCRPRASPGVRPPWACRRRGRLVQPDCAGGCAPPPDAPSCRLGPPPERPSTGPGCVLRRGPSH